MQEIGVGRHVRHDDVQDVVALAGHRKAFGHDIEAADVTLEGQAVLLGVLDHGHRELGLDREAGQRRVEQRHLPLDQAQGLEVADTSGDRAARHAALPGQFALTAGRVPLHGLQQAALRPAEIYGHFGHFKSFFA